MGAAVLGPRVDVNNFPDKYVLFVVCEKHTCLDMSSSQPWMWALYLLSPVLLLEVRHGAPHLLPAFAVAQAFNPSTWEAEVGGSLSSRPSFLQEQVPGQASKLQRNPVSGKKEKERKKKKKMRVLLKFCWGGGI